MLADVTALEALYALVLFHLLLEFYPLAIRKIHLKQLLVAFSVGNPPLKL